ncbi:uncharacterized protein LOC121855184 isoform X2 [Homarus americanus]|uniref:uncharacterized protein LOC121855184 isoform X2 n=1 Tax=Homarus americanus TaxID=6706 RepID=UPI001C48DA7A|nr:uncharacterized protein LOC121855184 isoform X2 [Homarus americanus]
MSWFIAMSEAEREVEESPHFLIHTPGCVIPDFDPLDPTISKYRTTENKTVVCSTRRPLTETQGLLLVVYKERAVDYGVTWESLNCSYRGIKRIQQNPVKYNSNCDKTSVLHEVIPIKEESAIVDEDGILVTCQEETNGTNTVYKNVHYFVQPRVVRDKRKKFQEDHGERRPRQDPLSVIVMGTDAVSRGNLRRHMPETFDYLKKSLGAIDLHGFNKVADNTDPNMIAALMGLTEKEFKNHPCVPNKMSKFDDCPLIWKNYSENGYATAYGEDSPWMGLFHYNRAGYVKQPTDYYNRASFLISEREISHNAGLGKSNGRYCQGSKLSASVVHDYSLLVADALKDIPYFGFYWTASLSHDYLTMAKAVDRPSLWYLQQLHSRGYLDHTILFFISDHGQRWGDFRSTYAGMLEERLPYVMIVFPPWFKDQYPEAWANLHTNTRRLTSTFDIHVTLRDILTQAYTDLSTAPTVAAHGQSLFREVPLGRTCENAGISDHFCTCLHSTEVNVDDPRLKKVVQFVVKRLNQYLSLYPKCVPLKLDKILRGRVGTATNSTIPQNHDSVTMIFNVAFVTNPGAAEFEGTVRYQNKVYQLVSDVSRINQYGNQSHCINHSVHRKYCYCRDMLPTTT